MTGSKWKRFSRLAVVMTALALVFAGAAVAYTLPKAPGTSGGPATSAKGGNKTSKANATAMGNKLAALTPLELAQQQTFTFTAEFPAAGTVLANVSLNGTTIGQGHAGRGSKGSGPLSMTFTHKGQGILTADANQVLTLTVKTTFIPNHPTKKNKRRSSTVTVVTLP